MPGAEMSRNRFSGSFQGRLVDQKVTFRRNVPSAEPESESSMRCRISEHPRSNPSFRVVPTRLSAAERYSRFRLDPRIPEESFERLYETWIVRSVLGDLADAVLIAGRGTDRGDPAGLISVSLAGGEGSIGLIAVDEVSRHEGKASAHGT